MNQTRNAPLDAAPPLSREPAEGVPASVPSREVATTNLIQNSLLLLDSLNQQKWSPRRDSNPRPSEYETDARRRPGRLQTDRGCSRWMLRRSRGLPTDPEGSSG